MSNIPFSLKKELFRRYIKILDIDLSKIYIHTLIYDDQANQIILLNENKQIHHDILPAWILFNEKYQVTKELYFEHGKIHHLYKPSEITYTSTGEIDKEFYYIKGHCLFPNEFKQTIIKSDFPDKENILYTFYTRNKCQYPNEYAAYVKKMSIHIFE